MSTQVQTPAPIDSAALMSSNPFPEGFGGTSGIHVIQSPAPAPVIPSAPAPSPALNVKDVSDLMGKGVFFITRYGIPGNSRQVVDEGLLTTDCDKALLTISKKLLKSPELEAIKKADTRMRTFIYKQTFPFEQGIGLLPNGLIDSTVQKCEEYRNVTRPALVEQFLERYPALCEMASIDLGSLHRFSDYPSLAEMAGKFYFEYSIRVFSTPGNLSEINSSLYKREMEKAAKQAHEAALEITALMRQTMAELVSHLHEKLTPGDDGKPRILRASAVDNLKEFLQGFDFRNITNDTQLADIVSKARALLSGADAEMLRNSDLFREKIRAGIAGISSQLATMVELKPGRMFREE